jgi:hypothetical protein
MLNSLLPLEGFYDFQTKFLQQVLDKNLFPSSLKSVVEVAILNKFYKTLTSHKSLI